MVALYVLCAGVLIDVLDATIVNVALPSIKRDLGFSQSNLAWVLNSYLIAFGGLLSLAGRVGDLIGQRRVFLTGLAVFTAASAFCALAQSQGVLIAGRPRRPASARTLTTVAMSGATAVGAQRRALLAHLGVESAHLARCAIVVTRSSSLRLGTHSDLLGQSS